MARRSRTGWIALGISLALHLLVVLLASSRLPELDAPAPRPALEVEVVHLPPAAPPPTPPAPSAPAPKQPARKRRPPQQGTPPGPRAPSPQDEEERKRARAGAPATGLPADAPLVGRGTLLLPSTLPPAPGPPDDGVRVIGGEGGLKARESRGDVAGSILRESAAQQNVARGNVHAYFGQLRDVLEQVWDVRRVAREGRRKSRVGAQVRLTQGAGGELRVVELVFSSSDDDIDRGLIADLRAAARRLPPPPPEVVRGRAEFSSVWTFQFMARTPYRAAGAMATFDIVNLVDKKAIPPPLDKRVELLQAD